MTRNYPDVRHYLKTSIRSVQDAILNLHHPYIGVATTTPDILYVMFFISMFYL